MASEDRRPRGPERRKHARTPAYHPCVLLGPDLKEEAVEMVDLSESGIRLKSNRSLPPMTQVQVALLLPATRVGRPKDVKVLTRGVVVWSHQTPDEDYDTGVFFPDLREDQRNLLATYVVMAST